MPQETPTDYSDQAAQDAARRLSDPEPQSWLEQIFPDARTPRARERRAEIADRLRGPLRLIGTTALLGAGVVVVGYHVAAGLALGESEPTHSPDPRQIAIENAVEHTGPNEEIVGSFVIDEQGEGATEGLDQFLADNPSVSVDPSNIDYSKWSSIESGRALNGVQPGETIQVTLDDINDDGKKEIIMQRPVEPKSNE